MEVETSLKLVKRPDIETDLNNTILFYVREKSKTKKGWVCVCNSIPVCEINIRPVYLQLIKKNIHSAHLCTLRHIYAEFPTHSFTQSSWTTYEYVRIFSSFSFFFLPSRHNQSAWIRGRVRSSRCESDDRRSRFFSPLVHDRTFHNLKAPKSIDVKLRTT